ncbi:hypothetical protein [Phycicoccus avicenniae]|uniref:hypothetical protein n=1 Tax=Phycicoccus avicenniae TaxID=2828860 RepID=UPI0020125854|nr:hypothetical protein [Phycicoccus avicenniae]
MPTVGVENASTSPGERCAAGIMTSPPWTSEHDLATTSSFVTPFWAHTTGTSRR